MNVILGAADGRQSPGEVSTHPLGAARVGGHDELVSDSTIMSRRLNPFERTYAIVLARNDPRKEDRALVSPLRRLPCLLFPKWN